MGGRTEQQILGILGGPATVLAAAVLHERAAVGDVDVAVDERRGHLRDVARRGKPRGGGLRETAAIGRRWIRSDLLRGRIHDVEVVQAGPARLVERVDAQDVVAERRRAIERDPRQRALAGVVGRAPAPQRVLRIEDQQILAAGPEEARCRDGPVLRLHAVLDHQRRRGSPEPDPVDGRRRGVDDVRVVIRTHDHGREVGRPGALGRLEREQRA